ncbi:related to actin-related protein RO7 [Rhynchosporium agropyri]|uniref:Related to actin-related protein RO7 n=1 Tax=Rhynchosporium agropyri TaxID=914238 RepID=A0A1E1K028_9HELO|nr:related to actin-related protein RO7 [Rhynchosporium agropyri]
MSNSSGPSHRNVANIRSPASAQPGAPAAPHTPLRTISSTFGSPSALRAEEDCIILELGSRYLRIGFAGDALPKAIIDFGPEEQRRPGDLRRWKVDYTPSAESHVQTKGWGEGHELWRPDLRGLDMGLVGDKLDRAVRDAFTKFLLIDSRPRRMLLAIPSALPLPLLSTILDTLFTSFQPPTISLMSAPVLATVAAGLRSALVVDIGWAETVVTGVYEYREVQCTRSVRGMKMLGEAMFKTLSEAIDLVGTGDKPKEEELPSFDECEEVLKRMGWCKPVKKQEQRSFDRGLTPVVEEDEFRSSMKAMQISEEDGEDATISIPLSSTQPRRILELSASDLAEPCENALLATSTPEKALDDEELPLHLLIYRSLLRLPVDLRSVCMSRIMFVGGGSNILGLKSRVVDEVASLIAQRGWDPVVGRAVELTHFKELQRTRSRKNGPTEVLQVDEKSGTILIPAALQEQELDPIEEQLKREARKGNPHSEAGYLRAVVSLGAWSGGSLLSQLKIPAISVVDREQWLQQGVSGASRSGEIASSSHRQSMGPGVFNKTGAGDRSSWTLGLWG